MNPPGPTAAERRRLAAMAGHRNDPDAARAALADVDPAVRATGLGALARSDALGLDDLRSATADPAPAVRARAAELAFRLGSRARPVLVQLLGDARDEVVEAACFGAGEMGEDAATAEVVEALTDVARRHRDALCRESAVAALGAIGDRRGLDTLLAAMADKPAVRRRAVLALSAFDGPEVDEALQQALGDRDWQVRQAAEDLTGQRPGG